MTPTSRPAIPSTRHSPQVTQTDHTATRRSMRELESRTREQARSLGRPRRRRLAALVAMVAVGGMAVTTSTPALALGRPGVVAGIGVDQAAGSGGSQSLAVASDAATVSVQRDGFSVKKAPKAVPVPSQIAGYSTAPLPAAAPASGWVLPVAGSISDPFGPRPDKPVAGVGSFHSGTDIAAPCGTSVSAAAAGTVVFAGWNGTYGYWVLLDNGAGIQTGYAHNSSILVSVGQTVAAGDAISRVGSTGASTGCHLHVEVRENGTQIDPQPFMNARGVSLG